MKKKFTARSAFFTPRGLATLIVCGAACFIVTGTPLAFFHPEAPTNIITVTNTNDSGPGSLRQALLDANDGDEITFAVTGTITLTSDELLVNHSINISGPGSANLAVNGNGSHRVFHVSSGQTVTISDLMISNGNDYNAGGIYNDGATLTVNDCVFSANSGGGYGGGGIMNDASNANANLTVNNCLFDGNSADFLGGGILNFTTSSTTANLTVSNCTISNNSADDGGGIVNYGSDGTVTSVVSNTTITGNSAEFGRGGAIHNDAVFVGGSATLTVSSCTISNNSAYFSGGGIGNSAGNLQISNCTVSGNSAGSGGGVYTEYDEAEVDISNSTLSGNSGASGGGVYSQEQVTVTVTNSTLSGNSANSGGGIYYDFDGSSGGTVILANTVLKTGASGENIYNFGGQVVSQGYNLSNDNGSGFLTGPGDQINTDPVLGPLQDNGGPTFTHALLPGSPAIDAGDPNFTPPPLYDQRGPGFDRVVNGRIDIGSFEVQGPTPTPCTGRCAPTPRPRPTPAPRPTP